MLLYVPRFIAFYVAENYLIAQDTLYLFGHSSVDGHLGCFQFLGSLNKVARNNILVCLYEHMLLLILVKYIGEKWLGHMVGINLMF